MPDVFLKEPIIDGNLKIDYFGFIKGKQCFRKGFTDLWTNAGGELCPKNDNEAEIWFLELLVQKAIGNTW